MHKAAPSLLLVTALLAGCAADGPTSEPVPSGPAVQYQDGIVSVSLDSMPRDPPAPGERTLAAAPQWRLGEWWTYEMTDGFTGQTYTFTRVVAGEDPAAGNYLVGFPLEEFSNDVMLFHVPGFGDIAKANLAYETHDAYFQMLDFPLEDGKTWEAEFEGQGKGPAMVAVQGDKALIELITPNYHALATYDPELGEISEMTINNGTYASYRVTGHGYDYRGVVRVPHAHDLVFIHGRLAGVVNVGASNGAGPVAAHTETVEVPPGYDRLSFIIAVGGGPAFGLPPPPGVFQERVTAPDGTVYEAMLTPVDVATGTSLRIVAIGHDDPTGTLTLEHLAAGAGIAFVEGIGYHSIDIELPSGCVVASFNAQHHNTACTVGGDAATAMSQVQP
jgi:hypothetical protein